MCSKDEIESVRFYSHGVENDVFTVRCQTEARRWNFIELLGEKISNDISLPGRTFEEENKSMRVMTFFYHHINLVASVM